MYCEDINFPLPLDTDRIEDIGNINNKDFRKW